MYQIFADETLIYDSTLEEYKIGSGQITKELDKSGAFVFSIYPDHPYYNRFVALKTVVTVYKSGRIVFRGRVLSDQVDYWNNKVLTCEGELGFLQDSVVRPYEFQGAPASLLSKYIDDHNAQVDDFKKFKLGTVDIQDGNDYINRNSGDYSPTLSMMNSALTGSALGGHFYITHGDDGTDPIPTIHYLKDFSKVSTQSIEFGENLKDYAKTTDATELATAIIPLGATSESTGKRTTIESVNGGKDYIYSEAGKALRGWVCKPVVWDDVAVPGNLLTKARAYLDAVVNQNITVELNAIDLHLLDRSIESFNVCEYVHVTSQPHGFDETLLCNKQTMDLLSPDKDTVVLGFHAATFTGAFTGATSQMEASVSTLGKTVATIYQDAENIRLSVEDLGDSVSAIELWADSLSLSVSNKSTSASIQLMVGDEKLGTPATIQMSGLVTFSGLSAGTTTIDGGCIKTGTIAADRIDATDLEVSAANITGKLTATQIDATDLQVSAANITGELTAATIKAGQITGGTLNCKNVTLSNLTVTSSQISSLSADKITSGTLDCSKITVKNLELDLEGQISFDDLTDGSTEVSAIIKKDLLAAPTIKGGIYKDTSGTLELDLNIEGDNGQRGLNLLLNGNSHFAVWCGSAGSSMEFFGIPALDVLTTGTFMPKGTWDFSACTVRGL